MKITLEIFPERIDSLARFLNADAAVRVPSADDATASFDVLTRIVVQAGITHGLAGKEIDAVTARDYASWSRANHGPVRPRRLPKSTHTSHQARR